MNEFVKHSIEWDIESWSPPIQRNTLLIFIMLCSNKAICRNTSIGSFSFIPFIQCQLTHNYRYWKNNKTRSNDHPINMHMLVWSDLQWSDFTFFVLASDLRTGQLWQDHMLSRNVLHVNKPPLPTCFYENPRECGDKNAPYPGRFCVNTKSTHPLIPAHAQISDEKKGGSPFANLPSEFRSSPLFEAKNGDGLRFGHREAHVSLYPYKYSVSGGIFLIGVIVEALYIK